MDETTAIQTIDKINDLRGFIHEQEHIRDAAIRQCQNDIDAAQKEIDELSQLLREYAEENPPEEGRTLTLGNGALQFRKQPTRYTFANGDDVKANDERLIRIAPKEFVKEKTVTSVDWGKFKARLIITDDGTVVDGETGEIIAEITTQVVPDKFIVHTLYRG